MSNEATERGEPSPLTAMAEALRMSAGENIRTVEDAEAAGYLPIGFVTDPDCLRKYVPVFDRGDGMCWAKFNSTPTA